jgi:ABC-type spermidine/putrescine transport system permease subunit II
VPDVVWVLSFLLQLVTIPIAMDVSAQWLGKALKAALLSYEWLDLPSAVLQTVMPDLIGFLIGYAMSRFPAALREPARWLFVVPAVLLPILIGVSYSTNLHDLFKSIYGVRGTDFEGLGVIGLIFPACGVCLYSIGIRTGDQHSNPLANVFGDEDIFPTDGPPLTPDPAQKPDVVVDEQA